MLPMIPVSESMLTIGNQRYTTPKLTTIWRLVNRIDDFCEQVNSLWSRLLDHICVYLVMGIN